MADDMGSQYSTEKKKQWIKIMEKVNVMRADGIECDFTIKVDNKSLSVHRIVIRAASDYFDKMLSHDTLENQNSSVNMKDVDFPAVKKCVDFMYTGEIDIPTQQVMSVLHVASIFQLSSVSEKAVTLLEKNLNCSSFFEIKENAMMYNLEGLKDACDKFALENLEVIAKEKGFCDLDHDYVVTLLKNKVSSHPDSEDSKLAMILLWINADFDNRKGRLMEMSNCLKLSKISPSYGLHISDKEKACYESSEFMKKLYRAQMTEHKYTPKEAQICFNGVPNSILLFDISNKELKAYNPKNSQIKTLKPLHGNLDGTKFYTACICGKYCYALLQNKSTFRLDITSPNSNWEARKDMIKDHDWISCATVGETIFVVGGDCMERYSEVTNTWSVVNTEGVICDQSSLAATDEFVFCVGGSNNGDVLNNISKLTVSTMKWSQIKQGQHKRATPAVAISDGILYVAGGIHRSFLDNVEAYDIKSDSWSEISCLKLKRNLFSLCLVDGKILAIGKKKEVLSIEVFDIKENTWNILKKEFNFAIMGLASVSCCLN